MKRRTLLQNMLSSIFKLQDPGVSLAKPRSTLGFILRPASRADLLTPQRRSRI
jgi:hypothetical protein